MAEEVVGEITTDVYACVRCGKSHKALEFNRLNGVIHCGPFEQLTHWTMCPEIQQPILLGIRDLTIFRDPTVAR